MAGTDSTSNADPSLPQIVKTEDVLGGDPRLDGHRIAVYHIYQRYVEGNERPEAIATSYDISVAKVHAALAYAFSHPDEMRAIEARNDARAADTESDRLTPDDLS